MMAALIQLWLDWPVWLAATAMTVFWLSTAAALWWFFQRSPLAPFWGSKLGIVGPPALLFCGPDGQERREHRIVGFLDAERFNAQLRSFQQAATEKSTRRL